MNNFFKRAACLAVTAVMTLSSTGALACTGYYVGKQANASGHTIIGHTVDAWNTAQAKQVVYPHSEEPGRTVTVGANEVPLPDVTYQYTSTPFIEGLWDNAVANEMGVTMTGAITAYACDTSAMASWGLIRMCRTVRPKRGSAAISRRFPLRRAKLWKTTARSWKLTAVLNPTRS